MAVAGRFMTKCEIVWGMVRRVGEGGGMRGAERERRVLEGMEMVFWEVALRLRSSSAAV